MIIITSAAAGAAATIVAIVLGFGLFVFLVISDSHFEDFDALFRHRYHSFHHNTIGSRVKIRSVGVVIILMT